MVAYEDNDLIIIRHYVVAIFRSHRMDFILAYPNLLAFRSSRRSGTRLRLRILRQLLFGNRRDDDIRPWHARSHDIIRHGIMLT